MAYDEEDKQSILDLLTVTLQATRGGADVDDLIYHDPGQVEIVYNRHWRANVCVAGDSGLGIIKDVVNYICRH